ncbi:MAG: transcriptional regulator [Acetivibrio ethanolgignens]
MDKAQMLKSQILEQYRSVRQFAISMDMPYSTLATALDKGNHGIESMAYRTVIAMCEKLDIDPVDFESYSKHGKSQLTDQERRVLDYYSRLNELGQVRALENLEDYKNLDKYRKKTEKF